MSTLITDRSDWKLRVKITPIASPTGYKHFQFIGEQYNDKGELTSSSTYDFFLDKDEVNQLSQLFWVEAA